jgi:hypothetical protein
MKASLSSLALIAAVAFAQERCDAQYPNVYCNTTDVLAFESYDCKPFHIFLARGSDEPYPGRQGNLTRQICSRLGGEDQCGYENIEYPAKSTAWGKDEWCKSAAKGAANGQAQFSGYAQNCPNSSLILLGYSQGASVAQDILGGGGGQVFECSQATNPALDSKVGEKGNYGILANIKQYADLFTVVAAVTFGAVARSKNQNFTVGDGKPYDGTRARTTEQLANLNKYSDRLQDYCHFGDPICAIGSTPQELDAHLNYFMLHNKEVIDWVVKKAKTPKVSSDTIVSSNAKPSESQQGNTPRPTTASSTSTPLQTSVIAKSAAMPTTTPMIIAPTSTSSTTDPSKAAPAQDGTASQTGAASSLSFAGLAPIMVLFGTLVFFAL